MLKVELTENYAGVTIYGDYNDLDFLYDYYKKSEMDTLLSSKVSTETGKGLSTNDYTDAEKAKLANIQKIEDAITNSFALTPDYNTYTVRFPLWSTSNTCAGEKLDDNVGKSITLATDTTQEVNNYGVAFESIDCNAEVDSSGVRHITALKGDPNFKDTGKVDVFCLFRTYWSKIWTESGYLYISIRFMPTDGYTICPLAINKDGSYNAWFVKPKYVAGLIDGKLYGSKGLIPAHYLNNTNGSSETDGTHTNVNYTSMITLAHARGSYYSGGLMAEYMDTLIKFYIQFATRNTQSIMAGNTSNSYQYVVATAESNVNRVILTTAQAANFDLYTYVSVGDRGTATNNDRQYAYMHNLANNVQIIGKEVIDSSHTALVLDHDAITTTSTTYVSSMHERSGFSDRILGRNGSCVSNTNGKHGFVFNGVEMMVGGYEVAGNAIMNIADSTGKREVYVTNDSTLLSGTYSTITSRYTKSDLAIQPTTLNSWNYITEYGFDLTNGLAVPTQAGQSGSGSGVGYADGLYVDSGTSGQREFLWLGLLSNGSSAGLSCLSAHCGIASGNWNILARLSINGVGGELAE